MPVNPIQTFFVPLPQEQLYESLSAISSEVRGSIQAAIGIAVAAPGTVIYYDHWEDGYEIDVTQPTQASTQIWGDGDLANGIAPGTVNDLFVGGDVVNLINTIPIPRDPGQILYDGGDRIQASFPIAVTTGSFAEHPGSYLAGASEVFATDSWSTAYLIPIGEDTPGDVTNAFEYTALYVMAGSDDTIITVRDTSNAVVTTATLAMGETFVYRVDQGWTVDSSKPIQAQLITGDIGEQYEMRWYSLTPRDEWSNEYYSPVAEEVGSTGFWFYNPNLTDITIHYDRQDATGLGNFVVAAGESRFIEVDNGADIDLPSGMSSGLRFYSDGGEDFFALAQVDADDRGATFDWGIRLLTPDELTPQVLVGLGLGNSANDPQVSSRSVVWVTPVADAIINVDFNGDGIADATIGASALESVKIDDDKSHFPGAEGDQDMSGASIWAVDGGGNPVDIAAAWGQDPSRSQDGDTYALDLGTLIPPLPGLTAAKSATLAEDVDGDGRYDPGDTIEYTITVLNFTRVEIPAGGYSIVDDASPVFDNAAYVAGSTTYTYATGTGPDGLYGTADDVTASVAVADNGSGSPFPLDADGSDGIDSGDAIAGYERQTYIFKVKIADFADLDPGTTEITNTASLLVNDAVVKDLDVTVPLAFETAIEIVKYTNNHDANVLFDVPTILVGNPVSWNYSVTNTGNVYLANVVVVDDNGTPDGDDDFLPTYVSGDVGSDGLLAPGEVWLYDASGTATLGLYRNVATVTGDPVYAEGTTAVAGLPSPSDDDPSAYFGVPLVGAQPSVRFDKQAISVNGVSGAPISHAGDVVAYAITITNDGDVPLPYASVQDPLLASAGGTLGAPVQTGGVGDNSDELLNAGETWTYVGTYTVQQSDLDSLGTREPDDVAPDMLDNTATLYFGNLAGPSASAQVPIVYVCDLAAVKSVVDVGGRGASGGVENPGDVITYEIAVTNNGSRSLTGVVIDDPLLEGPNGSLEAPIESMSADGVLEVGETWTYLGTYTVQEQDYYGVSGKNHFATAFIRNTASFESGEGCEATTNQTKTRLINGEIICGTNGDDYLGPGAGGDLEPTAGRDMILGGGGDDVIEAIGGNDWLGGGKGRDTLTGGEGSDSFVFTVAAKASNADKILDFAPGEDKIVLDSAVFKTLAPGALSEANFALNKAQNKDDYVIYNKNKDALFFDSNGSKDGGMKLIAKLKGAGHDAIDAGDIFVV